MEERDSSAKIRLLPPDAPDGAPEHPRRSRRWMGPAALLGGIAAFALVIGLWPSDGAGPEADGEDATRDVAAVSADATTSTTTAAELTSTPPQRPPLLEIVPDLAPELWLAGIAANADGSTNVVTTVWNGRLPSPGQVNTFDRTFAVQASFAPNSRMLAVVGVRRSDGVATLYVGSNASLAPQFVGVSSYAWVHSDTLEVAFVGAPPGDETTNLYHAYVAPSGSLINVMKVGDVGPSARIVGAGDWGYLMTEGAIISKTALLDPEGTPLLEVAGTAIDVRDDGTFLLASRHDALTDALDVGATLDELGFDLEPVPVDSGPFALLDVDFSQLPTPQVVIDALDSGWTEFSPDGALLLGTQQANEDRWRVRTAALDGTIGRTTSVLGARAYLGWSSDGNYVIYSTDDGMAFHRWDEGTTHYVDFDRDYELLTVGS